MCWWVTPRLLLCLTSFLPSVSRASRTLTLCPPVSSRCGLWLRWCRPTRLQPPSDDLTWVWNTPPDNHPSLQWTQRQLCGHQVRCWDCECPAVVRGVQKQSSGPAPRWSVLTRREETLPVPLVSMTTVSWQLLLCDPLWSSEVHFLFVSDIWTSEEDDVGDDIMRSGRWRHQSLSEEPREFQLEAIRAAVQRRRIAGRQRVRDDKCDTPE